MDKDNKKLKIGFYSPYFHIFGGGERYILTLAEFLSRRHEVVLFSDETIKEKAKTFFNITLDRVHFLPDGVFGTKNLFRRFITCPYFDIFFYLTDGSLFFSPAQKNYLLIQSPAHIPPKSFFNLLKLQGWRMVCNSKFTQNEVKNKLGMDSDLLFPPINLEIFKAKLYQKRKIILSVGRYFSFLHTKKQLVLLDVFKKYFKKYFFDWKLVIAGGLTEDGGREVVDKLQRESVGYPIEIVINAPFTQLVKLYCQAKIYWHAAGFGEDTSFHPEKAEHFGITTVEAMAAGAVPVVYKAGGQVEIVNEGEDGFLWENKEDLVRKTVWLIKSRKLLVSLSENAIIKAQQFSCEKFYEKLDEILF